MLILVVMCTETRSVRIWAGVIIAGKLCVSYLQSVGCEYCIVLLLELLLCNYDF